MGYKNTLGVGVEMPTEPEKGSEGEDQVSNANKEIKQIIDTGSIVVEKNGHFIHCLTIIGQIEGHYILPSQNKTTIAIKWKMRAGNGSLT